MKYNLNEMDHKLLAFCENYKRSVNEIARYLNISPASVSTKIKKLKRKLIITRKGHGKKTFVRTRKGNKIKQHVLTLLTEIKKKRGVTDEEYAKILPCNLSDPEEYDRSNATLILPFCYPKLVYKKTFITKEGEKFIKENSKKKS